ncbi:MAG: MoxR family ATPase [Phycisphaerales bacterium]|nr:MoxR family ATPase [Phycisphaerae bacterium]NNF43146.1 MoxR family ATPase [Phycisphaerales bacterium]NNM27420.1 MoxR family ATPase [Phycisphaerales bacterium]
MGNTAAVDRVLVCLLSRGHILIEDVPGVGKTVLASALARSIECSFTRIQCTPDLLPSDIIGVTVYDRGTGEFDFKPGPVFHNVIVVDEINRTTPRTQSALLEAMSEVAISVDGTRRELPQPFIVVATQNPYEFEGTYFLPENQLDRFLMRINLGYPAPDDEARIIEKQPARSTLVGLSPVMTSNEVLALQAAADAIRMDRSLVEYVIALASATREHEELHVGLSPRGALALSQAARATAVLRDRDYCVPEDIVSNVLPVCAHRIVAKTPLHAGDAVSARRIMQQVLETVPSPA